MCGIYYSCRLTIMLLLLSLCFCSFSIAAENPSLNQLQLDVQGDVHYSRYNFTDIKIPYDGIDAWAEIKGTYWIDGHKTIAPYISIIPSWANNGDFWWQDNIQLGVGVQWYPFTVVNDSKEKVPHLLNGLRLYGMYLWRDYYDKPGNEKPRLNDVQAGADIYYDNIFSEEPVTAALWSTVGFRRTNFSMDNYNALLWSGNAKVGKSFGEDMRLFPYAFADWTYVPKYDERWWENFLRIGGGIRLYPLTSQSGGLYYNLLRRLNVYAEVVHNVAWLGASPPDTVKEMDYRFGFSFSTFYDRSYQ